MNSIPPKVVRQVLLAFLILLLGGLIFYQMLPYLAGVLGAVTLYVILRRPMLFLIDKGWWPSLAAVFLMILSFICILLPVAGTVLMLGNQVGRVVRNFKEFITAINDQIDNLEALIGYEFSSQIDATGIAGGLAKSLEGFAGGTFNTVIAIAIMYFLLFYMLTNRRKLRDSLREFIPTSVDNQQVIGDEITAMVRSNALGIPMVAFGQGLVALIGFLIFGTDNPFLWAGVVVIGSMIPFVGGLLGIVPVFIIMLSQGETFQAWGVLLYGVIVVGIYGYLVPEQGTVLFIITQLNVAPSARIYRIA